MAVTTKDNKSQALFARAKKRMPGGVNSPVRAFNSVGLTPRFMERARGSRLYDVDVNEYIDFVMSWGPMLLGHDDADVREAVVRAAQDGLSFGAATEKEVEMAELIAELVPAVEVVRMVNSGTEAVMSAIRLARAYTGRDRIIKFAGNYHGHSDSLLVKSGSGVMTAGVPDSAGIAPDLAKLSLTANYNDLASVEAILEHYKDKVACIVVEPVAANMGVVLPRDGFLAGLRRLCDEHGVLLIFDEVITGFRLGLAGASAYYNVKPDLLCFGKIIGAGMPVGAYGGREDIMRMVAPDGPMYQAGTLSGNPVAMSAGLAILRKLQANPEIYTELEEKGAYLRAGLEKLIKQYSLPYTLSGVASLSCLFFTATEVQDYETAKTADTQAFSAYFKHMLNNGIYLAPSQFEALFVSAAHSYADLDAYLATAGSYFATL